MLDSLCPIILVCSDMI